MNIAALALSAWVIPGSAPCNLAGEACWTPAFVPAYVIAERAAGEGKPGEICRGDIIANTGARDGKPFRIEYQVAAFADSECIPSTEYSDGWHDVEICGNPVRVLRRAAAPVTASIVSEYMRGGSSPAGPRTWEGASAHVALPHIPGVPVIVWPVPGGSVPGMEPPSPGANPPPEPPNHGVNPPSAPPIPAVPLPASAWLFLAALASLLSMRGLRR